MKPKLVVVGAAGRMGKRILSLAIDAGRFEIIAAIERGDIAEVSINGGAARMETIEPCVNGCTTDHCELCNVPRGVILGELDDIAFTWVANKPIMWRGKAIPQATPGVKTTAIEPI